MRKSTGSTLWFRGRLSTAPVAITLNRAPRRPRTLRGKNGKEFRSFAFAYAFGRVSISALSHGLSARTRTDTNAAPSRQAGGHWFEPSTAHCPTKSGRRRFASTTMTTLSGGSSPMADAGKAGIGGEGLWNLSHRRRSLPLTRISVPTLVPTSVVTDRRLQGSIVELSGSG
jgi:hypothetical protein